MLPEFNIDSTGQQFNSQLKTFLYTKDKRDNINGERLKMFNVFYLKYLLILIVMIYLALLIAKLVC